MKNKNKNKTKTVKFKKVVKLKCIRYKNALQLAGDMELDQDSGFYTVVDGNFVFGDFIEAFIHDWNFDIKELTVSTLSMNENNIENLANIIKFGHVEKINLIVSDYFYGHEKFKLLRKIALHEDLQGKITIGIARTHMKVTQFETKKGNKIVIHGSANLRSSANIEQFVVEENKDIYDFNKLIFSEILKETKINEKVSYSKTNKIVKDGNK